jgi:hypothetical protein
MKRGVGAGLILTALIFFATVTSGHANLLGFYNISNNSGIAPSVAGQFSVEYGDLGGTQVYFKFTNVGVIDSSITDVYFDDKGALLEGISGIEFSADVSFSSPATPADLPGGENINPEFAVSAGLSADSDTPVKHNGVNNNEIEWLKIIFDLQSGGSFASLISDLASGTLRIGIKVQAIGPLDESDGFVNIPVPEPTTMLISALGLLGMGAAGRKRIFRKKTA